jgi:hypothetical protein
MKGLDVLIVRLLPFALYFILCVNLLCCWFRIDAIIDTYDLHSNSVIYALSLFLISLSNKRYHCIYNRAMYIFLIVLPIFNFLDATLFICATDLSYMITVSAMFALTAFATAFLAIRHFIQMSKRRLEHGSK